LGFPILNDPLYNQPTVWGTNNGKDGKYEFSKEQIEKNFLSKFLYTDGLKKFKTISKY